MQQHLHRSGRTRRSTLLFLLLLVVMGSTCLGERPLLTSGAGAVETHGDAASTLDSTSTMAKHNDDESKPRRRHLRVLASETNLAAARSLSDAANAAKQDTDGLNPSVLNPAYVVSTIVASDDFVDQPPSKLFSLPIVALVVPFLAAVTTVVVQVQQLLLR